MAIVPCSGETCWLRGNAGDCCSAGLVGRAPRWPEALGAEDKLRESNTCSSRRGSGRALPFGRARACAPPGDRRRSSLGQTSAAEEAEKGLTRDNSLVCNAARAAHCVCVEQDACRHTAVRFITGFRSPNKHFWKGFKTIMKCWSLCRLHYFTRQRMKNVLSLKWKHVSCFKLHASISSSSTPFLISEAWLF